MFVNKIHIVTLGRIHLQCMNSSLLRRLFIPALSASAGLLCLQIFWMRNEWKNSTDVLQRQIEYAFQSAIDTEEANRKEKLSGYLKSILSDTNFIDIKTRYNEKQGVWMITMSDAKNKKDYSSWSNSEMKIGPELTEKQKTEAIDRYVADNVTKNVENNIIFFYTQRFGELWTKKYKNLSLDTLYLQKLFKEQLAAKDITTSFVIRYTDTSAVSAQLKSMNGTLVTKPVFVNYSTINDYRKKYMAVAYIYNPVTLLFRRLWLALATTFLLLSLMFYCLYRMYKTILQQKHLHELKNDFIGNMTHELKTPIATVTAAIDGLQYFDGLKSSEKTERYLNTSRMELQRLNDIVSKVLDISIYERQEVELSKEQIEIVSLLETVVQSFEVRGVTFSWEIQSEQDPITVSADKIHLKNVLYNLVDNAVKYVPEKLHLIFSVSLQMGFARITVKDNGKGIEEKHLLRIFEKFYRVPSGNVQNVKGFGLGLFYVKQIIEQHGGSVEVSSTKNQGTSFTIQLPA
jgi:two-component system phosphate regulon sensor histidine kinase PhoR